MNNYTSPLFRSLTAPAIKDIHPLSPTDPNVRPPAPTTTTTTAAPGGTWVYLQDMGDYDITFISESPGDEPYTTDTGTSYIGTNIKPSLQTTSARILSGTLQADVPGAIPNPLTMRLTFNSYSDTADIGEGGDLLNNAYFVYGNSGYAANGAPPTTAFAGSPFELQAIVSGGTTPARAEFTIRASKSALQNQAFDVPQELDGGTQRIEFTVELEVSEGLYVNVFDLDGANVQLSGLTRNGNAFVGTGTYLDFFPQFGTASVTTPTQFIGVNTRITIIDYVEWYHASGSETYSTLTPASISVEGDVSVYCTGEILPSYPTTEQSVIMQTFPTNPFTDVFTATNYDEVVTPETVYLFITGPEYAVSEASDYTLNYDISVEFLFPPPDEGGDGV